MERPRLNDSIVIEWPNDKPLPEPLKQIDAGKLGIAVVTMVHVEGRGRSRLVGLQIFPKIA